MMIEKWFEVLNKDTAYSEKWIESKA